MSSMQSGGVSSGTTTRNYNFSDNYIHIKDGIVDISLFPSIWHTDFASSNPNYTIPINQTNEIVHGFFVGYFNNSANLTIDDLLLENMVYFIDENVAKIEFSSDKNGIFTSIEIFQTDSDQNPNIIKDASTWISL